LEIVTPPDLKGFTASISRRIGDDPGLNDRRYYAYHLSEGLKIYALLTIPDGEMPAGSWPGIVFNRGTSRRLA